MQDSPDAKKPCKGILKTSSSFDKPNAGYRKSAKFDELNVLQTYHPADKDYGHMKIEEPKTPYNYLQPDEDGNQLDANLLAEKLRIAANTQTPSFGDDDLSDDEFPETEDEKIRRLEFERRRKAHYNEFEAVKLARKLIQEELGDDSEDDIIADSADASGQEFDSELSHQKHDEENAGVEEEGLDDESVGENLSDNSKPQKNVTISSDINVKVMDVDQHPCAGQND